MRIQLPPENVLWSISGIFAILVIATIIVRLMARRRPGAGTQELLSRVRTWWIMAAVFSIAVVVGRSVSIAFMGFVSFLALKEYLSLIPTRRADRRVLLWVYLAVPLQFWWVHDGWYGMFLVFIPVYMFLLLPLRMVTIGSTSGFLHAAGILHWGLMTTVFSLSHATYLLLLPEEGNPVGSGAGWLLYLVFLTQFNDIAQFFWGKLLGKHKVIPKVSPNKTWEGLLGGVATTSLLALALAPVLTSFDWMKAVGAGLLIGVGGFVGDVTISALKRDLGVKDSGSLLPGHGGILDRVDSLTYTAPLFFHYVYYFMY